MAQDIFGILKQDHREVMDLFKKADRAEEPAERWGLFEELRDLLEAHTQAEKDVFYDRLRNDPLTRSNILEGEQEHHIVTTLLRELGRMKPDSDRFAAKLHVLRELVRHHVDEEENDVFPKAKQVLDHDEPAELGRRFHERKETVKS